MRHGSTGLNRNITSPELSSPLPPPPTSPAKRATSLGIVGACQRSASQRARGPASSTDAERAPARSRRPSRALELLNQSTLARLANLLPPIDDVSAKDHVLSDWRKQKILPFMRAANLLSRGAILRASGLHACGIVCQILAIAIVRILFSPPGSLDQVRRAGEATAVCCWVVISIFWAICASLDLLFNLVEYRREARAACYSIRKTLGLYGRPGTAWHTIEEQFFKGQGAYIPKSPQARFNCQCRSRPVALLLPSCSMPTASETGR